MAELTIQVPDELTIRLEPLRDRLLELLLQPTFRTLDWHNRFLLTAICNQMYHKT